MKDRMSSIHPKSVECVRPKQIHVSPPFNAASLGSFACFLCSVQEPDREEKTRTSVKNHRISAICVTRRRNMTMKRNTCPAKNQSPSLLPAGL